MEERKRDIRVTDVIERADVGRSTFYSHYSSIDDLHLDLMKGPLGSLADGILRNQPRAELLRILGHFWENRYRVRDSFEGKFGEKAEGLLAKLIAEKWGRSNYSNTLPLETFSFLIAAAEIALLRQWMMGRVSHSIEDVADGMIELVTPFRTAQNQKEEERAKAV